MECGRRELAVSESECANRGACPLGWGRIRSASSVCYEETAESGVSVLKGAVAVLGVEEVGPRFLEAGAPTGGAEPAGAAWLGGTAGFFEDHGVAAADVHSRSGCHECPHADGADPLVFQDLLNEFGRPVDVLRLQLEVQIVVRVGLGGGGERGDFLDDLRSELLRGSVGEEHSGV